VCRNSFTCCVGTAIRCCWRYSEASGLSSHSGLTIEVRDFCERLPVLLRCRVARLVLVVLYWANFDLTSESTADSSDCREERSSAMGLSARYFTLFHWKDWR